MEHHWQKLPKKGTLKGSQTFWNSNRGKPGAKRRVRQYYPPFPAGEGDVLQTRSVPPDDPQTPDKQYGSFLSYSSAC